jgi:hypothetical protein
MIPEQVEVFTTEGEGRFYRYLSGTDRGTGMKI